MTSPVFNALSKGNANNLGSLGNLGNLGNLLQRFKQFQQSFKGDPRQQIQQMLNSGKISQADYNNAVQMANQLMQLMKN